MQDDTYFWEVANSPLPSKFLRESTQFGASSPVFLIDQYSGRQPYLFNQEYLETEELKLGMFGSVILDSNLMDEIVRRVSGRARPDGLEALLRFVAEKRWDMNPNFYYMEHFAKSTLIDFVPNAIRRTRALLEIHAMDDAAFLESGVITTHPDAVTYYLDSYNVSSLEEVAEARVKQFISKNNRRELQELAEGIEVSLIKMVLLHKLEMPRAKPMEKYYALRDFLMKDLGILLGREAHFALHYFADRAGSMLGIQANTPLPKALEVIRSTAWDLLFVRMPEFALAGNKDEMPISYIATQEKRLQELARLYSVERLFANEGVFRPVIGYKPDLLPSELRTPDNVDVQEQMEFSLVPERQRLTVPVGLLHGLRQALEFFCRNAA